MKKFAFVLSVGVVGLILTTTAVYAQGTAPDHLLCYKMQDSLKFPIPPGPPTVDMLAVLQPEFAQRRCKLGKPKEFCVPATKTNVTPSTLNVNPNIVGQPLQDDYVCYDARCPKVGPPAKVVTDQFGTHRQLRYEAVKICVPAIKTPLGCPIGGTSAAACGGVCPDPAQKCHFNGKAKTCECVTQPTCTGKPDRFGVCGGTCPAGEVCQSAIVAGATSATCHCQPPPPPGCSIDSATGTCGGTCATDPTKKCGLNAAGDCTCVDVSQPCAGPVGANGCGGSCPLPGQQCHPDSTGICTCASSCGPNPLTGACGGGCPQGANLTCQSTATGCQCLPPPCGSDANGVCGGPCPSPLACGIDASGACHCLGTPPPQGCGPTTAGPSACGGACPAPTTCQLLTGGTAATCGCK